MRLIIVRWVRQLAAAVVLAVPMFAAAQSGGGSFTKEQLDQLTAPIALYPDSLLSQVLMASTYPDDVAKAAAWSRAHSDQKGDDAVKQVENQPWDPSVQSMVAFPQVIIMMGEKPDWVRNLGDAFLAQPDDVMQSVQRLRAQAQKAGNLSTNKEVKVSNETVTVQQTGQPQQVIVIEPAQPQVVYVPQYNPTVVYGAWPYPAYPPYYIPPPPGYWFSAAVATGVAWGVAIGVTNALWGGCNWGRGDVNINVNRYNNINVNNRINNGNWNHNVNNRGNVPYRGGDGTRQQLDRQYQAGQRDSYRGKDTGRDAQRQQALQSMERGGVQPDRAAVGNRQAPTAAPGSGRQGAGDRGGQGAGDRGGQANSFQGNRGQGTDREAARSANQYSNRDNAFRGASDSGARAEANRGATSRQSMQQPHSQQSSFGGGGGGRSQQMSGGGGGSRQAGGGGGGGGGRPAGGGGGGGRAGGGGGRR